MALRTLQLCVVFAIGISFGPVPVVCVAGIIGGGEGAPTPAAPELPIRFGKEPQDVTVARGQPATLRCGFLAAGRGGLYPPAIRLTWLRDGIPLNMSEDSRFQLLPNMSLQIRKVAGRAHAPRGSLQGRYSCEIRTKAGALVSRPAVVAVASLAREFSQQPTEESVVVGQPVMLPCRIQSTPPAKLHWTRNGKPISKDQRHLQLPEGNLLITATETLDVGLYRCIATNKIMKKSRESNSSNLNVIQASNTVRPPKILQLYEKLEFTGLVGDDLEILCMAAGWPKPTIQWIDSYNTILSNTSVLRLQNLTPKHTGPYTCVALNSNSKVSQIHVVSVEQPPYFNKTPKSQWFPSARTVRLECSAGGIPPPEIRWYKDGSPLQHDGRIKKLQSVLILSHTFTTDSGFYQCVAENKVGLVWVAARLMANVSNQPGPPVNVRCRSYNRTSICLQWEPPPNVSATAYSVHSFYGALDPEYLTKNNYLLAERLLPDTNYTFYVRLYSKAASDQSKNITCQTVLIGSRNLELKVVNAITLQVKWATLSSDTPCGGNARYKLQWRRSGHSSNNVEIVLDNSYVIKGLTPSQSYEIRVQSSENYSEELPWTELRMPAAFPKSDTNMSDKKNVSEHPTLQPEKMLPAPTMLEAEPSSPQSINLTWKDTRVPSDRMDDYYMVCYLEVLLQQSCDNESNLIKSTSMKIEIDGLKPYTLYEFKVRSHDLDGHFGPFSHSVECRTPEDVPSPVTDLMWKPENKTTVCLRWRIPNQFNGHLHHYQVSYTSDQNLSLDEWPSVTLPVNKVNSQGCWRPSADTVSVYLESLSQDLKYIVIVRAATSAGFSQPNDPVILKISSHGIYKPDYDHTSPPSYNNVENIQQKQKLGIIVGVTIALLCIIVCITCMIFRRRCLKSRALNTTRTTGPQSTNGQGIHTAPTTTPVANRAVCQPMSVNRQCAAEAHELQCLVQADTATMHIPPLVHSHLDTKGGVTYPNGQVNGLKYVNSNGNLPNGTVNITENPRFDGYDCNGHYSINSDSHKLLQPIIKPELDTSSATLDDSLNCTQLTNLDTSLPAAPQPPAPLLGPNG